jgi:hypothetical protein
MLLSLAANASKLGVCGGLYVQSYCNQPYHEEEEEEERRGGREGGSILYLSFVRFGTHATNTQQRINQPPTYPYGPVQCLQPGL